MSISKKGTPAIYRWRLLAPRSVGTRAPHLTSEAGSDVKPPVSIIGTSPSPGHRHKHKLGYSIRPDLIPSQHIAVCYLWCRDRLCEKSADNDHINKPNTQPAFKTKTTGPKTHERPVGKGRHPLKVMPHALTVTPLHSIVFRRRKLLPNC